MKTIILLLLIPGLAVAQFASTTTKQIDTIENNSALNILLNPTVGVDIGYFTGDKALYSDGSGVLQESTTTSAQLEFLNTTTSDVQVQLDSKIPNTRTLTTTAPMLIDAGASADLSADRTLSMSQSSTSTDGWLSQTDWNTFNNKTEYVDPLTTDGDLLYRNTSTTRLPIGAETEILQVVSGLPSWQPAPSSSPTTTEGDLILRGASDDERLPIGTSGFVLTSNGTTASWVAASSTPTFTTVTKSASTTLLATGEENVIVDTTGGDVTLSFPLASVSNGLVYRITKLVEANRVFINPQGVETIGGEPTFTIDSKDNSIIVTSDGSNWFFLSRDINTKCQTKYLSANITTDTTDIIDLRFTNLDNGRTYKVILSPRYNFTTGDNIQFDALTSGTTICRNVAGNDNRITFTSTVCYFTSTATSMTVNASSIAVGNIIDGNGTLGETNVTLCEESMSFTTEW